MNDATQTPIRILSVEDNPADKRLISEILRMSQLLTKVEFVTDGMEALEYLYRRGKYADRELPDLVLLDLTLPRVDGYEVLQTIKSDAGLRTLPVLILTGSKNHEDVRRSYELHANTYIVKPFDLDDLTTVMRGIEDYWLKIAQLPSRAFEAARSFN